ncbi:alanine racemase [Actinobacteria bacterium YIM 96077]|uniref:Alanine racemase n=1 Tax=Phytoactinopolyspora halophila TaxID=1981511 RepID=A0A329QQG1_9ACTN|nr:alanine racemase [Phytoactinopolyspora halophila]AYY15086.1 alanine racemase [Actinobacteria bacterium YIM 96077]RAW14151.1 alanine racemase [Phytoactinopolyspora halophila]
MSLTLHVDASRWREHLRRFVDTGRVAVVPVAKGNGYGFGNETLAAEAGALGVETLAVGTYEELARLDDAFAGDLLVLTPWRPWMNARLGDERVIHTVSRPSDLHALVERGGRPRIVLEVLTSMRRHGVDPTQLEAIAEPLAETRFEGFALHLPLAGDHRDEARELAEMAFGAVASSPVRRIWVSHLSRQAASDVASAIDADVRVRVGSDLWLGDRSALSMRATVLDVHSLQRGERYGYRQRPARRAGHIVVVAGGTAHGVALEAPSAVTSIRQRAVSVAKGGLEATGRALSPFRIGGKQRWFAEPPHMQCSMLWLPRDVAPPEPGDEVELDVRFTTTTADRIVWE